MEIINLNLIPGKAWPVCHASQFDTGREIRVNLFEGAAVYVLSGDEVVDVIIKKPDGNQVTETLTNTADSYVVIVTTEQMTACEGANLGEVRITKGAQVIGSLNFILECEKSPDTGIESHSEINNLESQVAAIVADQYAAEDVVFDATPTAGHGVGFAVTSEGVKTELDLKANSADLATVATSGDYNDLLNLPTIPTDLDSLTDVTITTPSDDEILVYDNGEWVNKSNPASTANIAADYDENSTYNTGDIVIYNNDLYEATADSITGTFDPSKWTATTIDNVIGSLSTLTTTDKSSLVGAVNEVVTGLGTKAKITRKKYSVTLASNTFVAPFTYFYGLDITTDSASYGSPIGVWCDNAGVIPHIQNTNRVDLSANNAITCDVYVFYCSNINVIS